MKDFKFNIEVDDKDKITINNIINNIKRNSYNYMQKYYYDAKIRGEDFMLGTKLNQDFYSLDKKEKNKIIIDLIKIYDRDFYENNKKYLIE